MTEQTVWGDAANEIEQLADEELNLYRQLDGLMQRQREAIDREDTEQLMKVVGVKQSALERIGAIQKAIGPVKAQWSQRAGEIDSPQRERIENTFRQTGELIESILSVEDESRRRLQERRDSMMGEIKDIDRTRRASQAYGAAPAASQGTIEQKG